MYAPSNFRCSGAATTASRLGGPDLAIATLNDFVEAGQMVSSIDPSVPVIADADTGCVTFPLISLYLLPILSLHRFGGPAMVARTVRQYARAGIAGLHIEDQVHFAPLHKSRPTLILILDRSKQSVADICSENLLSPAKSSSLAFVPPSWPEIRSPEDLTL